MKKSLITGFTGMDGSLLADLLLENGYEVYGLVRMVSTPNVKNISHLLDNPRVHVVSGDLTDLSSLIEICKEVQPDEVYNLAAQSFVGTSWRQPVTTSNVTGMGALNVFEAVRQTCDLKTTKVYQASSSEMFGGDTPFQNEDTPFFPRSPYGVSKLFAHHMARIYRESYDMHISCGILFNHTGFRRGIEFVTQKIVDHATKQHILKVTEPLLLGNISTCRDFTDARDMVRGMHMILQYPFPIDIVLASGVTTSIKDFVNLVYKQFGTELVWDTYINEGGKSYNKNTYDIAHNTSGEVMVKSVPEFFRENELHSLLGDFSKAKTLLDWRPEISLEQMVQDMISHKTGFVEI